MRKESNERAVDSINFLSNMCDIYFLDLATRLTRDISSTGQSCSSEITCSRTTGSQTNESKHSHHNNEKLSNVSYHPKLQQAKRDRVRKQVIFFPNELFKEVQKLQVAARPEFLSMLIF